jgi:TonB-linked SusC/RagA family outer membrane protein
MKKDPNDCSFLLGKRLKINWLAMKLLTILLFTGSMTLSASSYSQKTKIDLHLQNSSLSEIFSLIEKSSDFIFFYNDEILNDKVRKSVSVDGEKIEVILEQLFEGTNIAYKIDDRQVFLYNKDDLKSLETLVSISLVQQPKNKEVSGTVHDSKGQPLPGATILIKGTTLGIVTDIDGKFRFNVPLDAKTLVISFVGMKSQEIAIAAKRTFDVVLAEETVGLEEVVAVGYSIQKKESVVGAISQVNNAALMQSGSPNITSSLSGKLSGVLTIQQTGLPGQSQSEIIIRGLSSWSGSAPLILIDGVERDFQDMDPNEVNTISVLKDASATAVFGSKGANGVILVTTKRGKLGKPQITFTGSAGVESATRLPSFVDSYTTLSMMNVARMNSQRFKELTPQNILNEYRNPSSPLKAIQYPSVDWIGMLTKPFAPSANSNLSVTGGTEFVKYFLMLGDQYEGSLLKYAKSGYSDANYWFHRFNYRANLDFTLSKTTQLSLNIGGEVGIRNQPTEAFYGDWKDFYGAAVSDFPANYPDWVLKQIPDTDYPNATGLRRAATTGSFILNPWSNVNTGSFSRSLDSKLFTDLVLDQKLDFITKGLSLKGKVALNTYYNHQILYANYTNPAYRIIWSRVGVDANGDGIVDQNPWERDGQGQEYYTPPKLDMNVGGLTGSYYYDRYFEGSLNYSNTFGKHSVTGLALINFQEKDRGTEFPYYNEALVGRATYDYSHKYFAEINIGYTGSERFAPSNRFGFFPSGAIGWTISEEKFFKNNVAWMNKLKLRYSDGVVGSDYAASRWLYKSDFYLDYAGIVTEDKGANTSAQWEEARKRDLGIEIGIFKNRFTFSVDLFDEQRSKMLMTPLSTTFLIGNSFKDLNIGRIKKHGIEVEAEYNNTTANNINYFIKGNFSFNENRILFRDDPVYAPDYTKAAGKPLGAQLNGETLTGTGYFTSVDDVHINPSPIALEKLYVGDYKFLDYNADGIVSSADGHAIKGQAYAPITYSFSTGFSYKGFNLSIMFQGNYGKNIQMSPVSEMEFYTGQPRVHMSQMDYWRPDNQDATHSTLRISASEAGDIIYTWGPLLQDRLWRNASYLRLKEIYAGYNINSGLIKRLTGISGMLVYANATNVLTFTKLLKEWDPEVKSIGTGWYPQLSRYNLGVKFTF